MAWVDVKEYEALQPDKIAVDGGEHNLKVNFLNSFPKTIGYDKICMYLFECMHACIPYCSFP